MSDPLGALTAALTGRYAIARELGAGGMATVYLAEDVKHRRQVALKVLRPELAAALGPERFLREIETTAALHHPHILPLYDSGEAAGFLYYVMPFVEGESLRDRLTREKQLPLDEALQVAREVADALSYAHSRGVIHRDIKPENILLESGHAMVADFGIAKAVTAAGGESLTQTGVTVGTPAYMSPEQAAGEKDLDGRSDLYALGCVLYEMLAGQPPFTGPTVESVVHQHLTAKAQAITAIRPAVPAAVAGALERALAKTPADRFSPVGAFAEAIRLPTGAVPAAAPPRAAFGIPRVGRPWALVAGVVVVVAVLAAVLLTRGSSRSARPTLVVLPFQNLGGPDDEYFADGMTEELTSRLAEISGLGVTSRTSALQYKGTTKSLRDIGAELGVQYVLEGTIRTARTTDGNDEVRVTPQLIRVSDDTHLWSDRFTAGLAPGAVFGVQADIAERVAGALDIRLLGAERSAVRRVPTTDPEAHDAYLLGRFQWNKRTSEALVLAVEQFTKATTRDSMFAEAWSGLADAYVLYGWYDVTALPREEAYRRAEAAARRAVALDSSLGEAMVSLAYARMYGAWDWDDAERHFQRAIALDPDYPVARYWYAELLIGLGRLPEALEQARRGAALAPAVPIAQHALGWVSRLAGDTATARAQERKALALEPNFKFPHMELGQMALDAGQWDEAVREFSQTGIPEPLVRLFVAAHHDARRRPELIRVLGPGLPLPPATEPTAMIIDYSFGGVVDSTVAWAERAYQIRSEILITALVDPSLGAARDDPRILALRRRMGLLR